MGQAKLRKDEISLLKTNNCMKIIAVKHLKDGSNIVLTLNKEVMNRYESKDILLNKICLSSWFDNLPLNEINQYVALTDGYKIAKLFNSYAVALHFYESDRDMPSTYSCRDIVAINNKESFNELLMQYVSCSGYLIDVADLFAKF
jgi:hypothetical protein